MHINRHRVMPADAAADRGCLEPQHTHLRKVILHEDVELRGSRHRCGSLRASCDSAFEIGRYRNMDFRRVHGVLAKSDARRNAAALSMGRVPHREPTAYPDIGRLRESAWHARIQARAPE